MDLDPAVLQPWDFWRYNWFLLCWTKYYVCLHMKQDLHIWESAHETRFAHMRICDGVGSFLQLSGHLQSLRWWEKLQQLLEQIMLPVVIGYVELCWHGNLVISVNTTGVHVLWLQTSCISVCKIVPYKVNNYRSIMLIQCETFSCAHPSLFAQIVCCCLKYCFCHLTSSGALLLF